VSVSPHPAHAQIDQLLLEVGTSDPREAVRRKARALITLFCEQFGEPTIPIDVYVLASMLGIHRSEESPIYSPDAELTPDGSGGVVMRVNSDRPETRQRFSVGHEISHTFFPGYELKVQCRPDPLLRDRDAPGDYLETLCDIGAAELLLPIPWFTNEAAEVRTAQALVSLATRYKASREAALRRFAETHAASVATLFLSWKLKPTEISSLGSEQKNLFGIDPREEAWAARQLRLDYAIPSERFAETGFFLPKDKSLDLEGPLQQAANGTCAEGEADLDLGAARGRYRVMGVPLYTPSDERGPNGEMALAAVIEPIKVKALKKKTQAEGPGLF
jgi:hypothetical protein